MTPPISAENRKRYPADWAEISRVIRVERAENRCECVGQCGDALHHDRIVRRIAASAPGTPLADLTRCQATHGEQSPYSTSIVVLTTAHLDHQPENCDPANLAAFCQRCHLSYDREHHAQTRAERRARVIAEREASR